MAPSRRDLLRYSTGALALGLPGCASDKPGATSAAGDTGLPPGDSGDSGAPGPTAPERSPEPAALWDPGGTEDLSAFPTGVQIGDATSASAVVRVRSAEVELRLRWAVGEGEQWTELGSLDSALDGGDAIAHSAVLDELPADTAICVVAETADGRRSAPTRFRTAPEPGTARKVVFGASSCFGGNEPWASLTAGAGERLDFFCLLGDTVYADGSATLADYRVFWDAAMRVQGMVDLTASTSLVPTWDDHEVDNNWTIADVGDERFAAALAAFRETLPHSPGGGTAGLWRSLRWGDTVELFVLECRAERTSTLYLSEEQQAWLAGALEASQARFKIILNSVPITDLAAIFGPAGAPDRWEGWPEQREAVLRHIADAGIEGVLWVAGDVHYAQVGRVDPAGGVAAESWEVFAGPAGSFLNIAADLYEGDPQYTWMAAVHNWCRFTCDPVAGTVLVEHVDDTGAVFHAIELRP